MIRIPIRVNFAAHQAASGSFSKLHHRSTAACLRQRIVPVIGVAAADVAAQGRWKHKSRPLQLIEKLTTVIAGVNRADLATKLRSLATT
jgi:hypothetical protein